MHNYLNNSVWATLKPSVHGIGVFAIRDISKGTRITDHGVNNPNIKRIVMSQEDFDLILPEIKELILDRTIFPEGTAMLNFVSPNADACLRSFMNHSDIPNSNGEYALRDIQKGEEITEDYNFYPLHEVSRAHHSYLSTAPIL